LTAERLALNEDDQVASRNMAWDLLSRPLRKLLVPRLSAMLAFTRDMKMLDFPR
jgi:hypothetical protein